MAVIGIIVRLPDIDEDAEDEAGSTGTDVLDTIFIDPDEIEDLVVTAVGVRPCTGWLDGSGVDLGNGIVVDGRLQASVPGVYAAGDCAAFWSARYGRRLRVEHWDTALHSPSVAAANALGAEQDYDPVPYFWSEQFGRMVQYVGHHEREDRLIWRGDPAGERWAACWVSGAGADRLVAVCPSHALARDGHSLVFDVGACTACGRCRAEAPEAAGASGEFELAATAREHLIKQIPLAGGQA